jgi:hypothetical protein
MLLVGAALLAGCGAPEGAAPSGQAPTATVDDVTDPTQGATMIAIATETAAAASPTPIPPPTATVDDVTDPTQGATPAAQSDGLLVSMHKTGGIAGVDEFFAVYAGGAAELRGRDGEVTSAQLPEADLRALQQLLASPELAELSGSYREPTPDAFIYELELGPASGKARTIVVTVPSDHPPVLDQLLGQLEMLRAGLKYRRQGKGDRRQATGERRQATGERRQATGGVVLRPSPASVVSLFSGRLRPRARAARACARRPSGSR